MPVNLNYVVSYSSTFRLTYIRQLLSNIISALSSCLVSLCEAYSLSKLYDMDH